MKRVLLIILAAACIAAGAGTFVYRQRQDRQGPQISVVSDVRYYKGLTQEELLQGVTAEDGNVTDTLLVEKLIENDNGSGSVVYVDRDKSNNISRKTVICQPDLEWLEMQTEEAAETEIETEAWTEKRTEAEIKEETEEPAVTSRSMPVVEETEFPQIETEDTSAEDEAYFAEYPNAPRIELSNKRVRIHKGDAFDPLDYVEKISDPDDNVYALWRDIQVVGDYNTQKAGSYSLTYYVIDADGYSSNRAKLILEVSESDNAG